jgi:hypothetical protein
MVRVGLALVLEGGTDSRCATLLSLFITMGRSKKSQEYRTAGSGEDGNGSGLPTRLTETQE